MRIFSGLIVAVAAAMTFCVGQNIVTDAKGWIENGSPTVTGHPVKHYTEDDPQWCFVDNHECQGMVINPDAELDQSQVTIHEGIGELVCPGTDKNDPGCVVEY
jgi:hypothetical protein